MAEAFRVVGCASFIDTPAGEAYRVRPVATGGDEVTERGPRTFGIEDPDDSISDLGR